MEVYRAARIITMNPEQPEIMDGAILVHAGRIVAVGAWSSLASEGKPQDLGPVTVVPGLINAHAHLGLSHLAGRIPSGLGFAAWADALFACLREDSLSVSCLEHAAVSLRTHGTWFVADIVNRHAEKIRAALEQHVLGWCFFQEFSGRDRGREIALSGQPGMWSAGIHALYSTDASLAKKVKEGCALKQLPCSLHLAEVPGENELFISGAGEFAEFLRTRRIMPKGFRPVGMSVTGYAHALGLLDPQTLAVHCVHVSEHDVELLAQSGASVCLCPRSNAWIGVGTAPIRTLREAGIPLCLGTDSLASNQDLDLFAEMHLLRQQAGRLSLPDLLDMATRIPAKFLGIDSEYGSLEPGKRAVWAILPAVLMQ